MPPLLSRPLKEDDPLKGKGRKFDKDLAKKPGGIRIDEVALGMQLAIAAITDDQEGTLESIGKSNPWHIHALELVTGSTENAFKPLSQILPDHLGFELDRAFSHTKITGGGHAVDTQGYIAHNDNDVVLAYRCTIGGFDWLTNLTSTTCEFEPAEDAEQGHSGFLSCLSGRCSGNKPRIHIGFYNGFLVTQKDVEELVEPHIKGSKERKRFFVVGHSLGAGIATVAFAYLLLKYNWAMHPHKLILVTAGGPRVCDEALSIRIHEEMAKLRPLDKCAICRIVRDEDVVPQVPMQMMGFRHLNKLVYVDKQGELTINPEIQAAGDDKDGDQPPKLDFIEEMKDMATRAFDHEQYKQLLSMIPGRFVDHMPDMYLEPLMALLSKVEPLRLKIVSATGLKNLDWLGVSDPYCMCKIKDKPIWSCRTPHVRGTLTPEWNYETTIIGYEEGDSLEFELYDHNTARRDGLLGRTTLEGSRFHKYGFEGDLVLSETGHEKEATLKVKLTWKTSGPSPAAGEAP